MKLSELIENMDGILDATGDCEIADIVYDSRQARPGALFVAMPGVHVHGRRFIPGAIASGASAVAHDGEEQVEGAIDLRVADVTKFLGPAAHRLFGEPSQKMTVIGITGTNGKTTVTYLLESILSGAGRNVGVIGTVNYRFGGRERPAPNTTPLAVDLARLMRQMADHGVDTVVMEVSSHGLHQDRVLGVQFDAGCYTNISRDHLDYHVDLDDYFEAKKRLFSKFLASSTKKKKFACVNLDDERGVQMASAYDGTVLTYGQAQGSDLRIADKKIDFSGVSGRLVYPAGSFEVKSDLLGDFTVLNLLAAASVAVGLGIAPEKIRSGIARLGRVPGRLERVGEGDFLILVDYAHTPEALVNVLESLNRLTKGRILTVFGCGGDRDPGKRPMMGAAAAERSHVTIVTSDNPRTEDPLAIIDQILPGLEPFDLENVEPESLGDYQGGRGRIVEPDRRRAIRIAIEGARKGDIVLIAGKGHEDYQIIGMTKFPFDDRIEAAEALKQRNQKSQVD